MEADRVVITEDGYIAEYVVDKERNQVRFLIGGIDEAVRLTLGEAILLAFVLGDNHIDAWVEHV